MTKQFTPISATRLYEVIVDEILRFIKSQGLRPGDRLPSEREMAGQFGVSRVVIREGIKSLKTVGLVEIRHGSGVYITTPPKGAMFHPMVYQLAPTDSFEDLWEFRSTVEPKAAEMAAVRGTEQDVRAILEAHEAMSDAVRLGRSGRSASLNFHRAIMKATHNRVFLLTFDAVMELQKEVRKKILSAPERSTAALSEHEKILEAILARDSMAAANAMEDHMEQMANYYSVEFEDD